MDYLQVKNWKQFQHYTDRNPPWIKLHNQLLDDYEFECLPDASKAHLLCIWMLASRTNNKIPADARWISKKIGASGDVDIQILLNSGFIELIQQDKECLRNASKVLLTDDSKALVSEEERRGENKDMRICANVEVKDSSKESDILESFDYWWSIYPKKQDKKRSFKKWQMITKKLNSEELAAITNKIAADIECRVDSLASGSDEFLGFNNMHASTYLNNERWNDER